MAVRPTVAVAAVALLVLAACGGGHSGSTAASTSTSARPTTTSASTTAPATSSCTQADPNALAALLPTTVPAGFVVQPDDIGDTGPSNLAKAANDDGGDNAAAELQKDGFRRGYQRLWVDPGDRELIAFIYEFCTAAGADAYAAHTASLASPGATPFTVVGIPGALGVTGTNQGQVFVDVQASPGNYTIQASTDGASSATATAELEQLATTLAQSLIARVSGPT